MYVLGTTEREYPWGTLRSTNASKVKVILAEKGVPFRVDRVRPGDLWKKPPSILARHPLGKVPWLVTPDDDVVYDSTVINEFLEERHPEPSLMPRSVQARARMRMLENFMDEGILTGVLPGLWMPMWSPPEQRDEAAMQDAAQRLVGERLPVLEAALEGDYLLGDFSLADAPGMAMAMVLQVVPVDLAPLPKVAAWLQRLRARPSYRWIDPQTSLDDSAGPAAQ